MSGDLTGNDPNRAEAQLALYEIVETEIDGAKLEELAADQIRAPRQGRLELHVAQIKQLLVATPLTVLGRNVLPLRPRKDDPDEDAGDRTGKGTA